MSADFHTTQFVRKTRKTKRCYWCGQIIPAGSSCIRVAGKYEGDFHSSRYHPECSDAADKWVATYRDEEFPQPGEMIWGSIEPKYP